MMFATANPLCGTGVANGNTGSGFMDGLPHFGHAMFFQLKPGMRNTTLFEKVATLNQSLTLLLRKVLTRCPIALVIVNNVL